MTYEQALQEIQEILMDLEANQIPVDQLLQRAKLAATLLEFCQQKLRETETDITDLLK